VSLKARHPRGRREGGGGWEKVSLSVLSPAIDSPNNLQATFITRHPLFSRMQPLGKHQINKHNQAFEPLYCQFTARFVATSTARGDFLSFTETFSSHHSRFHCPLFFPRTDLSLWKDRIPSTFLSLSFYSPPDQRGKGWSVPSPPNWQVLHAPP